MVGCFPKQTHVSISEYADVGTPVALHAAELAQLPTVLSYQVTDATHENAWDGSVEAVLHHIPCDCLFAWSNGQVTRIPTLRDVRPGHYALHVTDDRRVVIPFIHACPAAYVSYL